MNMNTKAMGELALQIVFGVAMVVAVGMAYRRMHDKKVFLIRLGCSLALAAGYYVTVAPMMATVTGWFDTHRSLAVSLVSAGMGVAPLTMAPIAARLVTIYDWRFAQLAIGLAAWALLLPAAEHHSDLRMRSVLRFWCLGLWKP